MKSLTQHISEKLVINKNTKITYRYHPTSRVELIKLVKQLIEERGNEADLNDIDVSEITDMSFMFAHSEFNGDISNWNVSNTENMRAMFFGSKFNQPIGNWNVSNVVNMYGMFDSAKSFNQDLSKWKIKPTCNTDAMIYNCPIKEEYKPN